MASMFVRKVADKKTGYIRIQICSNVREGKKVKQKIIRHIWCPWIKKRFCCKNTSIATSCLKISLNFTQYKKCSVLWKNNILYFQVYLLKSCEVGIIGMKVIVKWISLWKKEKRFWPLKSKADENPVL